MPPSRAIPPRFLLPMLLLVPLAVIFLPAPAAHPVSFVEVVSCFDETDPPEVRQSAVPVPWRDDLFTGWVPSMPWSDDESVRKVRVSRVDILEKRSAPLPILSRDRNEVPSLALNLLTRSLLLSRPPPPSASCTV